MRWWARCALYVCCVRGRGCNEEKVFCFSVMVPAGSSESLALTLDVPLPLAAALEGPLVAALEVAPYSRTADADCTAPPIAAGGGWP